MISFFYTQNANRRKVARFQPDDGYQKEFEDAFPYSETDDQLRSTAEIKRDMEKEKTNGSLISRRCWLWEDRSGIAGGFQGHQESKQVAFLVPTTILATAL